VQIKVNFLNNIQNLPNKSLNITMTPAESSCVDDFHMFTTPAKEYSEIP
jgi:hypothetical protein